MTEYQLTIDGVNYRVEAKNEAEARVKIATMTDNIMEGSRSLFTPKLEEVTDQPVGVGSEAD